MTNYKKKYEGLYEDVAFMLVNFRNGINSDHGRYLLREWDHIRSKYDEKDENLLQTLRKWI